MQRQGTNKQPMTKAFWTSSDLAALPDLSLLGEVLEGDEHAWRELLRRFRGLIFRCVGRVLCKYESVVSSEDINEVFSEVCLNLLRNDMKKLRAYDPERGSKLGSWIGLIAINTTYDHLRVTARQPLLDQIDGVVDDEDGRPSPLDLLLEKERWTRLTCLAMDFSQKDQRFMELYYGRGLAPHEVAREMRISIKTVYSKKNKIRNRLEALARATARQPELLAA
jgi:RNA polymerase sigma-70 factor, ECF subfamily